MAALWNRSSPRGQTFSQISLMTLENGSRGISKSVDFWNFLISLKALVPALYLFFFLSSGVFLLARAALDRAVPFPLEGAGNFLPLLDVLVRTTELLSPEVFGLEGAAAREGRDLLEVEGGGGGGMFLPPDVLVRSLGLLLSPDVFRLE